jgi:tight adherence protein C
MLLFFAVFLLAVAAFLVGEVATAPSRERRRALDRAKVYGHVHVRGVQTPQFRERVVLPGMRKLAMIALRLNPRVTHEIITARLLSAGLNQRISATGFLATKGLLGVVGGVFGVMFGTAARGPIGGFALAIGGGVLGFVAPGIIVTYKTRSRREELRRQLPDSLDLLAVSVEAGLGFDGAITKLTEFMEGPLVEEFAMTLGEVRIGESRHDALKKLAERVPAPEVASFVRSVVQADQLGISLGRILRVQAADSRLRRQALAEEKAMKAPIKMLFPTVFFIFPAMFIVILGSAFLNLANYL